MPKTITLRLKDEVYQEFSEAARSESRSVSNLIQTSALAKIREQQFAEGVIKSVTFQTRTAFSNNFPNLRSHEAP